MPEFASEYGYQNSGSYMPSREVSSDSAGIPWTATCGAPNIAYSGLPDFITIDSSTFILTIAPSAIDHIGTHQITIVQTDPLGVMADQSYYKEIVVVSDCAAF